MTMSMTGFGRGSSERQGREFAVEIKTVNHRYLDINVRLPRNLSFLEEELRKKVQQSLTRGRVEIFVNYMNRAGDALDVRINEPLFSAYLSCFETLEKQHQIKNDISISTLLTLQDLFLVTESEQDEGELKSILMEALDEALNVLKTMRENEGAKLREDLLQRIDTIGGMTEEIEEKSLTVVEEYRKKLKARLEELLQSTELDETRFNTEVAYFADRSNITEEIVRLHSHLEQFAETINSRDAVGRKLDFLVQEMNREVNTIGSKASDLTIVNLVVEIKSEIEKIREQIQNIE